jgi:hypothetical protein
VVFLIRSVGLALLGRLTRDDPLGALFGGALGTVLGIRTAMAITTAGSRSPH